MKRKDPLAVALGARGGAKTAQRGKEFYREIGKKGNTAQGHKTK